VDYIELTCEKPRSEEQLEILIAELAELGFESFTEEADHLLAYIPEKARNTLCVSSQVGCKMRCLFCMTGKQGLQGNLTANQILNQVRSIVESNQLT